MCRLGQLSIGQGTVVAVSELQQRRWTEPSVQEGTSYFHLFLNTYQKRGWSCCVFSHSHDCLEHTVQGCSVQGDQSPRVETQKTAKNLNYLSALRLGQNKRPPLTCFAFSPLPVVLTLLSFNQCVP